MILWRDYLTSGTVRKAYLTRSSRRGAAVELYQRTESELDKYIVPIVRISNGRPSLKNVFYSLICDAGTSLYCARWTLHVCVRCSCMYL